MTRKVILALLAAAVLVLPTQGALAQDEWHFGIGTGVFGLNLDGDLGFNAKIDGARARGITRDVDLDNSETSDLVDSAFGLAGSASKGNWTLLLSFGTLTLKDDDNGLDVEWDRTQFEFAGVYRFWTGDKNSLGVLFGVRSLGHEWDFDGNRVRIDSRHPGHVSGDRHRVSSADVDEDWTDVMVGLTHHMAWGEKWSWSNRLDVSFGDSEGNLLINSGINWHFAKHWQLTFYTKYFSVDLEQGSRRDSDFYLYDIDEFGGGVGITLLW